MTDDLKPWESHWPEGCEFFFSNPEWTPTGKAIRLPWITIWFDDPFPCADRRLAAHVAHSWFLRVAESEWREQELGYPNRYDKAVESAAAWAQWGGI